MFNYTKQSPIPEEELIKTSRPKIHQITWEKSLPKRIPKGDKDDLVRHDLGSHVNFVRRCPAVKKDGMKKAVSEHILVRKRKGGVIVGPEFSSTLKKERERELVSLEFERSLEISRRKNWRHLNVTQGKTIYFQSNPISDMYKDAQGVRPKGMRPASPLPTSPLSLNILNPETPRKNSRVESIQSKFRDIRIHLRFEDEDAPVRPTVVATPITPIMTTESSFPVQAQEYYSPAPWAFTTPRKVITSDFHFSVEPKEYSPTLKFVIPPDDFDDSDLNTPAAPEFVLPPDDFDDSDLNTPAPETFVSCSTTTTAPITPMITLATTDNDEEQTSTVASTISDKKTDKKIGKEPLRRSKRIAALEKKNAPLRRSTRIASIKSKPTYKE